MRILIDRNDAGRCRWRLVRRTPTGADLVARSCQEYPDEDACQHAAHELGRLPGETILAVQQSDGHWQWVVNGPDGRPLAESPAIFPTAAECGRAIEEFRRETLAFLGG